MAMVIGGLLVMVFSSAVEPLRVWSNLLVAAYFFVTLALGGALFLALTYITGAGWNVAFRRVPEAMATLLPAGGIAILAVLGLGHSYYGEKWHRVVGSHEGVETSTFWFKQIWLDPPFWIVRSAIYVLLWSLLSAWIVATSRRQDHTGDLRQTASNVRKSALFLVVYALTISLASIDWIMSLEPLWFSTMWGVYHFAGMTQATLAVVVIVSLLLRKPGQPLHGIFRDDHLHDLGKLLLGFSCFWIYIWFSQYMLIWYSNIPEETSYFIARTHGAWGPIVLVSILLNWCVPFFVLLPKPNKRSGNVMMKVAIVVLVGRWVDLYVMVFPPTVGESPVIGIWEVAGVCLLIGSFGLLFARAFSRAASAPEGDPYFDESLRYHAG